MLPDIQPGNTKILYFFNCLLDGMHTIGSLWKRLFLLRQIRIYFAVAVFLCVASFYHTGANNPASNVPEIECHTQETAQMIADSGVEANCAVVVARFVARTGILHTNFDRNGSFLCCIHTCKAACTVSKEVSKTVMKKNSNEDYGAGLEEF